MARNELYLLGIIPKAYQDGAEMFNADGSSYYYGIELYWENQEIHIKDTCDRHVPIAFEHLVEFRDTLDKVIVDILNETVGMNYKDKV